MRRERKKESKVVQSCPSFYDLTDCQAPASMTFSRQVSWSLGSKITADGDCRHEIKRRLLLGRKVMSNLDSILKSRDITLSTKVHLVEAMVFPIVMYGCESWTIKKAECQRSTAFKQWCWRRLLRVPWTAISNQSWIFIGRTDAEAEIPILWPPDAKNCLIGKDQFMEGLMLGKIEGRRKRGYDRGWDGWMASPSQWTWVWESCRSWWWTGKPGMLQSIGLQRIRHDWATELKYIFNKLYSF